MSKNNQNQSAPNWTSISREELKDAEIRSIQKRKKKKYAAMVIVILVALAAYFPVHLILNQGKHNSASIAYNETVSPVQDVALSGSETDALDWSYAGGMGSVTMFEQALRDGIAGVDLDALPSKKEILKAKLDAYGHPYVIDGDRFFIFYFQDHEQPWSDMEHGGSTVEKSGCGTLCLSMVLTSLTGDIESYSPDKLVNFLKEEHIAAPNLSVRSIPVTNRCLKTGIKIKRYESDLDLDLVDETLEKGGYIILDQFKYVGNESSRTFAAKNHYIVIRGGNQKDGYYIANPLYGYSCEGSEAAYAPQNTTQIPTKLFSAYYYYTVLP